MAIIEFSEKDLLRGKLITPGWYRIKVDNVGEAPAKPSDKGPSINYPVEATVLFNGDNGDTEFANVPIEWNFNSKAISLARGFLEAFGVVVQAKMRFDLKSAEGRELDVFIENEMYQNRFINKVNHKYRAPKDDVTAMPAVTK